MTRPIMRFFPFTFVSALVVCAFGDPTDWVNVKYVVSQGQATGRMSKTADAEATIVRNADSSAAKGPWTMLNSKNTLPPSKDPHDYLSWAPYHWPNCNWCPQTGRTHLAHTVDGTRNDTDQHSNPVIPDPDSSKAHYNDSDQAFVFLSARHIRDANAQAEFVLDPPTNDLAGVSSEFTTTLYALPTITPVLGPSPILPTISASSSTSEGRTRGPAQAAAKTTKAPCTPSPTRTLAPSATWTTCPYIARDGQVNPDVRTLNGPDAINSVAQSVIYNAVAYALKKSPSYSKNVANFIETFFLSPSTKMNPNLNFGQIVRGPGEEGRSGTFTGILDLRGMVKIANGISIMKAAGSPDWTTTRDRAMGSWLSDYSTWLVSSDLGRIAASRPNNHATFYIAQVASTKILAADQQGAITTLQRFFKTQFLDQLASSGEQPFEAVRTRPYHYRCFNLEALIANAKIGDQLGVNLWSSKSKYGATIQTALDFLLATDPKDEDVSEVFPHVAAIAAAYGDPKGKYSAFLKKKEPSYQTKAYWFYDQIAAISSSPAANKSARSIVWKREDSPGHTEDPGPLPVEVPFQCPAVFENVVEVEIDDGVFVTCDQLRSYYENTAAGSPM